MKTNDKTVDEVYGRMAALCSRSEQCSYDIYKKITALELSDEEAGLIIEKLVAEKFIDDERYVKSFVSDKFRFNKWGKVKIRHNLKMKGFPNNMIQPGLDTIDDDKYRELLIKTLKEKAKTVKKKNRYEKMGQLIRFAQGRGFEPEIIHRYLDEVM